MFRPFIMQIQRSVQSVSYRLNSKQSKQIFSNESKLSMEFCLVWYEPPQSFCMVYGGTNGILGMEWYPCQTHSLTRAVCSVPPLRGAAFPVCLKLSWAAAGSPEKRREQVTGGRRRWTETSLWPGRGLLAQGKQVSGPFQEEECFTVAFVFCFWGVFLAMNHFLFLKSLLDLLEYCFWYMFWFFWPPGLWHLSSPTREWSHSPCTGRRNLNPWNSGQVPIVFWTLPYTLFVHFYPPSLIFSVCFHSKMEYPDRLKSPQMNILSEGQMCLSILNKMLSICLHHKRNMLVMRALKQKVRKK